MESSAEESEEEEEEEEEDEPEEELLEDEEDKVELERLRGVVDFLVRLRRECSGGSFSTSSVSLSFSKLN